MCGIFGNLKGDYKQFLKLYNKNRTRGDFAAGALLIIKNLATATLRVKGSLILDENTELPIDDSGTIVKIKEFNTYLGHTQAPTTAKREFDIKTTHPFEWGNWIVAHNGVLTNDRKLAAKLKDQNSFNEVDSSVIPALLHECETNTNGNNVQVIAPVLSLLEGTFGLWIYNKKTHQIFLARSGSTLYVNHLTNEFSSIKDTNMTELEEGALYQLTYEGATTVGGFNSNSPFFL